MSTVDIGTETQTERRFEERAKSVASRSLFQSTVATSRVLFSHRPSIVASVRDIQAKLKKNFGKENFKIKIQGQGPEECVEDVEKANSEIKMEDGDESLAGGRW
nr:putative late blight resistance protein homolog R1B-17 [Ipomoea batatas]